MGEFSARLGWRCHLRSALSAPHLAGSEGAELGSLGPPPASPADPYLAGGAMGRWPGESRTSSRSELQWGGLSCSLHGWEAPEVAVGAVAIFALCAAVPFGKCRCALAPCREQLERAGGLRRHVVGLAAPVLSICEGGCFLWNFFSTFLFLVLYGCCRAPRVMLLCCLHL